MEPKPTYIYSFKLKLQGGAEVTGRVEAEDHRDATQRAAEQWSSYTVISGTISMLKNQELARKQNYIAI